MHETSQAGQLLLTVTRKGKFMRVPSKSACTIGMLVAVALTASAAEARRLDTTRFGGARNSVDSQSPPRTGSVPGGISYGAGISPYPQGHGGNSSSPDFQLVK
jgi:hypothetical protein